MMNKFYLLLISFFCSNTFAAEWVNVTSSSQDTFYVDKSYYKFNKDKGISEIWTKTEKNIEEPYTFTKSLVQYDCNNKKSRYLAYIEYKKDGSVANAPRNLDKSFSIIYPDTVDETLWEISCKTNGKGLYLKNQMINEKRVKKIVDAYNEKNRKPLILPKEIADKYYNNQLNSTQVKDLENDLKNGLVQLPY